VVYGNEIGARASDVRQGKMPLRKKVSLGEQKNF
jgi:hypothetical protein